MNRNGDIQKTTDGYQAVFTRELRHPPERVWAMLTDPERIGLWYVRCEIEPREGGLIIEHHEHAGADAISRGVITRFDPPRVLEHTWWDEDYAEAGLTNIIRWELSPTTTGTRLVLTHNFPELEGAWGSMAAWHIILDVLEDVLDGGDPKRHSPPRGELSVGAFVETTPGRGEWARRAEREAHYRDQVAALSVAQTKGAITGTVGMTIHVHDVRRATAFWERMGLVVGSASDDFVTLTIPKSGPLMLHKWQSACAHNGGRPPGTVSGLMLAVDDAAAACARVEKAGGRTEMAPFPAPDGSGTWVMVSDVDGNEFVVCAPT